VVPGDFGCSADHYFNQLMRDGITVIPNAVAVEACDRALRDFSELEAAHSERFHRHRTPEGLYVRIINLHQVLPSLLHLFSRNPIALAVQDRFLGSASTLYTSLYFQRGSGQGIHRDTPYFCTRPEYKYLGVWTALEDTDADNGPLQVVKRGHLLAEEDRESIARLLYENLDDLQPGDHRLWDSYQRRVMESCVAAGLVVEDIYVGKGSTVIWHPQLPHGGAPILDASRTRNSLVCHVTAKNAAVYHMNAFFNPGKEFDASKEWAYRNVDGRDYIDHGVVAFNHESAYAVGEFLK
jgi:ectoine hydroxylase-related dioxygenase (phytanoyl-CoA dioxygenase family)